MCLVSDMRQRQSYFVAAWKDIKSCPIISYLIFSNVVQMISKPVLFTFYQPAGLD